MKDYILIPQILKINSPHFVSPILKSILTLILVIGLGCEPWSQASLEGKVTDRTTGEVILFGTVAAYKNNVLITGAETDLDGNYYFNSLDPGTYDVEASHIGYTAQKFKGVMVKSGRTNRLDFAISEGALMDAVEIIEYKVPLIQIDNTTSGATVTAEAIKSLPKKNINSISATVAGNSVNNNNSVSIRGSRSNRTIYYVDGVRVNAHIPPNDPISNKEEYEFIPENDPKSPFREPLSTFSIDVDRASYSNVRRFIEGGDLPPKDAIRIEEMINYFNYNYKAPSKKSRPFKVYSQMTDCPWNDENRILHIGVQGRKLSQEDLPPSNLVFLIDVSGSMGNFNKLPLVKESFKLLLTQLREVDRVSIVTYAGNSAIVLPSTSASDSLTIVEAIDGLGSGGGTAGAQGIKTAYDIAKKNFMQNGNNRVILATDGDFNVGISNKDELERLIENQRKSGIYLSILGYGMGNYRDATMQSLADKGNGNHSYIDNINEAHKVLVQEFGGTLYTIAKDVKIQIEFNPAYVGTYRLIGYENRKLANRDFTDDTKDAGELGSGHSVTALYEITPVSSSFASIDEKLLYQKRNDELKENNEIGRIKLRFKTPKGIKSWEIKEVIHKRVISTHDSDRLKHAAAIAEFGMILKGSAYRGNASLQHVKEVLMSIEPDRFRTAEVLELVKEAIRISTPE